MMNTEQAQKFLSDLEQRRDNAAANLAALDGAIAAVRQVLNPPPVQQGPQLVKPAAEGESE